MSPLKQIIHSQINRNANPMCIVLSTSVWFFLLGLLSHCYLVSIHIVATEIAEVILRGTRAPRPRKTFYTRSISDPGLIPLLIASGVSFTALQVGLQLLLESFTQYVFCSFSLTYKMSFFGLRPKPYNLILKAAMHPVFSVLTM
jgi:hypothetical protein